MSNNPTVKRWIAKRKAGVVMCIFKGVMVISGVWKQAEKRWRILLVEHCHDRNQQRNDTPFPSLA